MKDLCHHTRNATTCIEGILCHSDKETRKQVREQLVKIENELLAYQERNSRTMYIPQHFKIYELVPQEIYESYPARKHINLWFLFDDRVLYTQDRLRNRYGKMICNTWFWGGRHHFRGWRPQDCEYGTLISQHKRGCAIDSIPMESTATAIRQDILADPWHDDFKHITCIEENISWLHQDSRNWNKAKDGIFVVNPQGG